jgi:hypothetical protein
MNDEIPADDAPRDLLGDPVEQNRESWGRPGFEKTPEKQRLVSVLSATGWKQARIARHLQCDIKTLRKHFSPELSSAADDLEAEALMAIADRMKEGNVSAARQILTLAEKGRAAPPLTGGPSPEDQGKSVPEDETKLGKKDQQAANAQRPTGSWGALLN